MSRNNSLPPPPEADTPQVQLSRPFRSRKLRPCDGCRRAKSRCAIPSTGAPCFECLQMNKQCTFDELPPERKKPAKPPPSPTMSMVASTSAQVPVDAPISGKAKRPRSPDDSSTALQALSYAAAHEKRLRLSDSEPLSLDLIAGGALQPHAITTLLTDDLLPIGTRQAGPDDPPLTETAYIRQISCDRTKPQYIIFKKRRSGLGFNSGRKQLTVLKASVALLDPPPSEDSLIDIYRGLSNPAFPLIYLAPDERPSDYIFPKLCVTALNHCRRYRSSRTSIRNLLQASEEGPTQEPNRLASVSAALLELSARPVLDVESNYILLARTIGQAQLLGLHINPATWAIPAWEKELRLCLWWALRIHDAWISFLNARPSHIQVDNQNVPLPESITIATPITPLNAQAPDAVRSPLSFIFLCRLSLLTARLQAQVCTLASSVLLPAARLETVKSLEEDTRLLLAEVLRDETGHSSSSGVASLMTCLLGFRCMLRRISIELTIGLGSPFVPDAGTLEMYAEAVDYICALDARAFDGFWLNYVGHILSSLTSSLIRLSLATSAQVSTPVTPQRSGGTVHASSRTNPLALLSRLQRALQAARRDHSWDLADAALNRAESVVTCLTPSSEYMNVVAALQGTYEPEIARHQANGTNANQPQGNGVHESGAGMDQYGWSIDMTAFGLEWNGADASLWGPAAPAEGSGNVIQTNVLPPMYNG